MYVQDKESREVGIINNYTLIIARQALRECKTMFLKKKQCSNYLEANI